MLRRCTSLITITSTIIAQSHSITRSISTSIPNSVPEKSEENGDVASTTEDTHSAYRERLIREILSRDKEIFEMKRQHELSMMRVEENQRRTLKDQEDRGMYYEQNCNVHTFDTVSVGLYTQRNTLYHTMGVERLRNVKLFVTLLVTLATCFYLYYRYMINPEWVYVEKPLKILGSRVGALRELREQIAAEEEKQLLSVHSNTRF
ncbi:uncharacterized protein TM35_000014150 [Trypanosoma theileri]|uniref:Transmembrane protein n=1 Tax=Trypanosoma theileri TaxID=67003 RepID=A0A1X0P9H5_9TRYP|nr:uncharacterized protein TM35_000014150 [Trypanosoma theileri]ORC93538.1 hypothetical protein TM35_000014150 [Trypanosoma theileri]